MREHFKNIFAGPVMRRSLVVLVVNLLGIALGWALQIFLARHVAAEAFGGYQYVVSVLSILVIFATMGVDSMVLRYLPAYKATGDSLSAEALIGFSRYNILQSSISISLIVLSVIILMPSIVPDGLAPSVAIGALALPFIGLSLLYQAALAGAQLANLARIPDLICRPIFIALICMFLLPEFNVNTSVLELVIAFILAVILVAVSFAIIWTKVSDIPAFARAHSVKNEWRSTANNLFTISVAQVLIAQSDVIILGHLRPAQDVALYAVALKYSQFVLFGGVAVNLVIAPLISAKLSLGDTNQLQSAVRSASRAYVLLALPIALLFFLADEFLIGLFGEFYLSAGTLLFILTFGQFLSAFCGPGSYLLTMSDNQRLLLKILAIMLPINLALVASLTHFNGVKGAAIASALSIFLLNIAIAHVAHRETKIDPTFMGWMSRLRSLL